MDRRNFIKSSVAGIAALSGMKCSSGTFNSSSPGKIALVKTSNRKEGVQRVLKMMDLSGMNNKNVVIKPNFNSAHDTPGSTHMDIMGQLVTEIQERGVRGITVGESSGPGNTQDIMETKGVFDMASDMKFDVINYDTMPETDWVDFNPEGNHWDNGFSIPRHAVNAEYNIAACCLKTHAYGGVFTMSLKLAVGLTPESLRRPLHQKRDTFMRHMIAELNLGYKPELIVLDGIDAFVDGGPSTGDIKQGDVILAGTDRVAIDAAGVAILKHLGSNEAIMNTPIFEHDQIKAAAQLGIGITSPGMIEFVTADDESKAYAETLKSILMQG
ncbi:MAG: DUF362 domain-containing protein [bacterium]|nr:DUF362 domain-containing protein [bacterium]